MYIIRNNTKGKVVLGDLNLIINFNEETDLDQRLSRDAIVKSSHLKHAISKYLLILVKDVDPNPPVSHTTTIVSADNSQQLAEMEDRLRSHFADEIKKIKTHPSEKIDIEDKMNTILQAIKTGGTPVMSKDDSEFEDDSDGKMSALHQKVIERITKNSSANIQSEEKEVKDSGVGDKADELEGLV